MLYQLLATLLFGCAVAAPPNVLYILADDMRADVGAYGTRINLNQLFLNVLRIGRVVQRCALV